jgi:hypothetical protein
MVYRLSQEGILTVPDEATVEDLEQQSDDMAIKTSP